MKRNFLVVVVVGIIAIIVMLIASALLALNWEKKEVETGFHPNVAKDNFTMAQRLLNRYQIKWHKDKDKLVVAQMETEPLSINNNTRLILDEAALSESHELNQQLLSWVNQGGELIYVLSSQREALGIDNSIFFQTLGIRIATDEKEFDLLSSINSETNKNTSFELSTDNILELELSEKYSVENCPGRAVKNDASNVVICDITIGNGRVIVLPSMTPFTNNNLRDLDHGSLLLWLAADAKNITYIPYLTYSNWFAKLWGWSWQLVIIILVLTVTWVWHMSSRIGRAYAPDALVKVSFNNHVQAVANFCVQHGHERIFVDALMRDFYKRVELKVPNFRKLTNEQQAEVIARLTNFDQQQVAQLLSSTFPESEPEKVEYIKRFKQLRNAL
ncbi:MAG: DUF4350 domain-containing protein [Pseudoalteromonas sp.]